MNNFEHINQGVISLYSHVASVIGQLQYELMSGSENTTNRVYISSPEFGWLPAKVKSTSTEDNKAIVEIKDYEDDTHIPACEVSSVLNPTKEQIKRGIKSITSSTLEIDLKEYNGVLPLQNVNEDGQLIEVEDMVDLAFLHEAAILYNLKARHSKGIPYTRTGDIVIAVNPYQWITELYSDERRGLYAEKLVWNGEFVASYSHGKGSQFVRRI